MIMTTTMIMITTQNKRFVIDHHIVLLNCLLLVIFFIYFHIHKWRRCAETRLVCFSVKMAAGEEAFACTWFCRTSCSCFYLQCLKNHRESKLKVSPLFGTFFKISYDKPRYFCNVFDARTLLPSIVTFGFTNLLLKMFAVI